MPITLVLTSFTVHAGAGSSRACKEPDTRTHVMSCSLWYSESRSSMSAARYNGTPGNIGRLGTARDVHVVTEAIHEPHLEIRRQVLREGCGAAEHHGQGRDRCAHDGTLQVLAVKCSATLARRKKPLVRALDHFTTIKMLRCLVMTTLRKCKLVQQTSWNITCRFLIHLSLEGYQCHLSNLASDCKLGC